MNRRKIIRGARYMLAALALCALCACGAVNDTPKVEPETVNAELDKLRGLGLFHAQFEVTAEDCAGAILLTDGEEQGSFVINGANGSFSYDMVFDPDAGKINGLSINALVQDDWEPAFVSDGYSFYDNYDAIIDPKLTVRQYCESWARYRGYDGYEMPAGSNGGTLYTEVSTLNGYRENGDPSQLRISFSRAGQAESGYAWICCSATASGPYMTFGDSHPAG